MQENPYIIVMYTQSVRRRHARHMYEKRHTCNLNILMLTQFSGRCVDDRQAKMLCLRIL